MDEHLGEWGRWLGMGFRVMVMALLRDATAGYETSYAE